MNMSDDETLVEGEAEIEADVEAEKAAKPKKAKDKGGGNSKKAFDAGRDNLWSFDPDGLCIDGGKCLPKEEQGPLDTEVDESSPLWDVRLRKPLDPEFVANISTFGVDTPILVVKREGIPYVVAGRRRVRAARVANRKRKAQGEPLMKIDAKQKRDSDMGLLGAMLQENQVRQDDDLLTALEKAKRLMNGGVSMEDTALRLGVTLPHFKTWLAFDDNALGATKKALAAGKISPSTAITLARTKEPEQQRAALDEVLATVGAGGKSSPRAAKEAVKAAGGKVVASITDKKTLKRLYEAVQNVPHPHNSSDKTLAFWEGAEQMLVLIMGEEDADQRLEKVYAELKSVMKTEQRAKK